MGIFGKLKDKVLGRSESIDEIGDIRSHVISGDQGLGPDDEGPIYPPRAESVPELPDMPGRPGREPVGFGPSPMPEREPREREPFSVERSDTGKDYDILDRLTMIEAQLSAIRSQTETINERLKNLEMRVGRRF